MVAPNVWASRYEACIATLVQGAVAARLTFCGSGACIDARVSMHDMQALLDASDPQAKSLAALLLGRAEAGVGGEVAVDWREGPDWLATHIPVATSLGGTGPHAAWVLSTLGAPALLCLGDRSSFMLDHVPPDILLAEGDRLGCAREIAPRGARRPAIFIFEYTAGRAVGPVMPRRSSRIIVRFDNLGLEDDPAFDALTPSLAAEAGAGTSVRL